MTKPLKERPLDMTYFAFFLVHIIPTLLLDLQAIYPEWLVPEPIAGMLRSYIARSQDPLMGGAMGIIGDPNAFVWFKTFLTLEAFFQLPVFILGIRGLLKDSRSIYVLLLIYGASTATTVLPCIATVLAVPLTTPETIAANISSITTEQLLILLVGYVPFFLVPFVMTIDMALRVLKLVSAGQRALVDQKTR